MEQAVDTKADAIKLFIRFKVNIRGVAAHRFLQHIVNVAHDGRVIMGIFF